MGAVVINRSAAARRWKDLESLRHSLRRLVVTRGNNIAAGSFSCRSPPEQEFAKHRLNRQAIPNVQTAEI